MTSRQIAVNGRLPVMFNPDLSKYWLDSGLWPNRTLDSYLDAVASSSPQRLAVVDARTRMSYAQLAGAAQRCAAALRRAGTQRGDVVSVQLPNWSEFLVVALGVAQIGAVLNPLSAILRENELRRMLLLCSPKAVIFAERFRGRDYVAEYSSWLPEIESVTAVVVVDGEPGSSHPWMAWPEFLDSCGDLRPDDGRRPSARDVAEVIFTSGTSGEPKGVMHTSNTLASCAQAVVRHQPITAQDVMLMPATFGHQTAYIWGVWMTLVAGCTVVLQESWSTSEFFRLVEQEGVTMVKGSTPYLVDVVASLDERAERAVATLTTFFLGGAPIPRQLAAEVERRGLFRLSPCWGMSENGPVTATWPPDASELARATDGHPYPGMEVQVRSPDGSAIFDAEGDLFVRGPFNFAGYLQGEAFTRQFLGADGWLDTGDRAICQQDGSALRITGRRKDLIVRGGENVPVVELEHLIAQHPDVAAVALVGVPDQRLGERACAVVEPRPGSSLTLASIVEFLDRMKVTKQYFPEAIVVIESMPRTVSGKIKKHELKDLAQRTSEAAR
jgi:cyclohexanecarboxylate-CoA ligase